jgi:hypothetical protein
LRPVNKHRPDWDPKGFAKAKEELRSDQPSKDGHYANFFDVRLASISFSPSS